MMNNNHKNHGCGFSEQLVSYLYGETSGAETAQFERHLPACAVCADEYEAFSGVKFSVGNWKKKEFARLATPLIQIAYKIEEVSIVDSGEKGSWLSALRGLFFFSPRALSLTAATLGILIAGIGATFIFLNVKSSNEVAGGNTKQMISPTPTIVEKTTAIVAASETPNTSPKILPAPKLIQPENAARTNVENVRVVKVSNNEVRTPKTIVPNAPKNIETRRNIKLNKQIAPKINDDEEDRTLRLAEIFDEIGSK